MKLKMLSGTRAIFAAAAITTMKCSATTITPEKGEVGGIKDATEVVKDEGG